MSDQAQPVAFWERWWSGDKSGPKNGEYHSNSVNMNLGRPLFGKDFHALSKQGPMELCDGQWYEVVPLFTKDMLQEK